MTGILLPLSDEERDQLFKDAVSAANGEPIPEEDIIDLGINYYLGQARFVEVGPNALKTPEMQFARDVLQAHWGNSHLVQNPDLAGPSGPLLAHILIVLAGLYQDEQLTDPPQYFG
jgi:hypothetical protein